MNIKPSIIIGFVNDDAKAYAQLKEEVRALAIEGYFFPLETIDVTVKELSDDYRLSDDTIAFIRQRVDYRGVHHLVFDHGLSIKAQEYYETMFKVSIIDFNSLILLDLAMSKPSRGVTALAEIASLTYDRNRIRTPYSLHVQAPIQSFIDEFGEIRPSDIKHIIKFTKESFDILIDENKEIIEHMKRKFPTPGFKWRATRGTTPKVLLLGHAGAGKTSLMMRLVERTQERITSDLMREYIGEENHIGNDLNLVVLPHNHEIKMQMAFEFPRNMPSQIQSLFDVMLIEKARRSDLIVHIYDGSAPNATSYLHTMIALFNRLGVDKVPHLHVCNKVDLINDKTDSVDESIMKISATSGQGIDRLEEAILSKISNWLHRAIICLPLNEIERINALRRNGHVLSSYQTKNTITFEVEMNRVWLQDYSEYIVSINEDRNIYRS